MGPEPHRYTLALEEARRGFDQLDAELARLRERASTALGIGALVASFLGGLAIRNGASLSLWTWLAISALVAVALLCFAILRPRRFRTSQDPAVLVGWAETEGVTLDAMERDLALRLAEQYDPNAKILDRLMWLYCGVVVALIVEISALVLDIWSRS
jgi:hypothetical protein